MMISLTSAAGERFMMDVTVRLSVGSASFTSTITIEVLGSPFRPLRLRDGCDHAGGLDEPIHLYVSK